MRPTKPHPHAEAVRAYRPLAALLPKHWRAHTVAAPDGANLRVTDTGGEGPAVLLLTARPMMPGASLEPGLTAFTAHWQRGEHRHYADCGHAIMFEALEEFVAELRRFWWRVSEPRL